MYVYTSREVCHVDDVPRVGVDIYSKNKGFCPSKVVGIPHFT